MIGLVESDFARRRTTAAHPKLRQRQTTTGIGLSQRSSSFGVDACVLRFSDWQLTVRMHPSLIRHLEHIHLPSYLESSQACGSPCLPTRRCSFRENSPVPPPRFET